MSMDVERNGVVENTMGAMLKKRAQRGFLAWGRAEPHAGGASASLGVAPAAASEPVVGEEAVAQARPQGARRSAKKIAMDCCVAVFAWAVGTALSIAGAEAVMAWAQGAWGQALRASPHALRAWLAAPDLLGLCAGFALALGAGAAQWAGWRQTRLAAEGGLAVAGSLAALAGCGSLALRHAEWFQASWLIPAVAGLGIFTALGLLALDLRGQKNGRKETPSRALLIAALTVGAMFSVAQQNGRGAFSPIAARTEAQAFDGAATAALAAASEQGAAFRQGNEARRLAEASMP
jgi:hypothetical protein